jgi:hypothetical protein
MEGLPWIDSIINQSYQTLGIEIISQPADQLKVYPNPASNQINISYHLKDANLVKIELFNQKGQLLEQLLNTKQHIGKHHLKRIISDYPAGIYFCKLSFGNKAQTTKFIKY